MPKNKNQIVRFHVINECLRTRLKPYWSKEELIKEILDRKDIRISERTLLKDIEEMRSSMQLNYNAPIKFSRISNGYCYTDPNYSIDNLPLNERDIENLEFATTTLSQYKSFKMLSDFAGTMDKIIKVVNHIKKTDHASSFSFIDFEKSHYLKGADHLDSLADCIKQKKVLELFYLKFNSTKTKIYVISPYLLKEYRNRWYLLGWQHQENKIKTFGLDRIFQIKLSKDLTYMDMGSFDSQSYFKNTIGVSFPESQPEEIILSFKPKHGMYVKTQHLHTTQEILVDNDIECKVRLFLVPNFELQTEILSFGEGVKVLKPISLRKKIQLRVEKCYLMYNKMR